MPRLVSSALIAFLLTLTGCSTLGIGYWWQAGRGQLEIFNRARPIEEVIQDPRTSPRVVSLLKEVPEIKSFGERQGLKATPNYAEYVHLDRSAVTWVVSASHPLKFEAKKWSFPIVGTFTYVGWFHEDAARRYAREVEQESGWDVDVRGASAYSTLGWFRDPILSTMISSPEDAQGDLVNTLLHESMHATLYVKHQSTFNESVAAFVGDRMAYDYLRAKYGADSSQAKTYFQDQESSRKRRFRMWQGYQALDAVYHSQRSDEEKKAEKQKIIQALREELHIKREINNATLIQFQTYHTGSDDFEALFKKCGENWGRFLNAVRSIPEATFHQVDTQDFSFLRTMGC